jgi:hypothetical protein
MEDWVMIETFEDLEQLDARNVFSLAVAGGFLSEDSERENWQCNFIYLGSSPEQHVFERLDDRGIVRMQRGGVE